MKGKISVILLDVIIAIIFIASIFYKDTNISGLYTSSNKAPAENEQMSFNFSVDPEEKYVKAGETVTVTISAKNINVGEHGINSIVGYLGYDEDLFESVSLNTEESSNWLIELNQIKSHSMYGKFCMYTMQEGVTKNQDIAKLVLKLKADLKPQTTKVTFTKLASSDGDVEVAEEDRAVTLIIYEDEIPEKAKDPEEPEVKKVEPKEPQTVKTGDKIVIMVIIAILAIILNIVAFAGKNKGKMLSMLLVLFVGISSFKAISNAAQNEINVADTLSKLDYQQSWLNSEDYLVTDTTVSRFFPETNIDKVTNRFNKEINIDKSNSRANEGMLSTGMKISVKNPSRKDAEGDRAYTVSVWGDTNYDGKSNQVELTTIIRNVIDNEKWSLSEERQLSADLTVDNIIDEKDVKASVKYIVYGDMEIPSFEQVEKPEIRIIEGTFNEDANCYDTDVVVKITEKAENAKSTQYKIENSEGVVKEYTTIERADGTVETTITLEKGEIYKVSAYTTGVLGNRSEIPYVIINCVKNNTYGYKVIYYYDDVEGETENYYDFNLGDTIQNFTAPEKVGYELDKTKGTNGIEGLPLTIGKNEDENVIKVYYKTLMYTLKGFVKKYDPNSDITEDSEVGGTILNLYETVAYGQDSQKTFVIQPEYGYKLKYARVYSGDEITGTYNESTGTELSTARKSGYRMYEILDKFENITEDKFIVAVVEDTDYVAQIVSVPPGLERIRSDIDPEIDLMPILGHKYTTLEDAISEADKINRMGQEGNVTIKIINRDIVDDIEETNIIESGNDIILNLNGHIVSASDPDHAVLSVENGGKLQIIDEKAEGDQTAGNNNGAVINYNGVGINIETDGEVTLGVNNDIRVSAPSTTTPVVQGSEAAISNKKDGDDEGTLNFYDGKLISGTDNVIIGGNNKINTPEMYNTTILEEDSNKIGILQMITGYEAKIGNQPYQTIALAVQAINNNTAYTQDTPVQIDVIADESVTMSETCNIDENKNVILNLNGRTVTRAELNTMFNVGEGSTLKIIDTSSEFDSIATYAELEKVTDDYYFVAGKNFIYPNNINKNNTQAISRIEINLEDESEDDTFELALDYFYYSNAENADENIFKAVVTTAETYPTTAGDNQNLVNINGAFYNADETAKMDLKGGSKYYLYLDYKYSEKSYLRIDGITINGNDLIKEVIKPKGKIDNVSGQLRGSGTVILDGAILDMGTSDGAIYVKNLIIEDGIIKGDVSANNAPNGKIELKNGKITGKITNYNTPLTIENDFLVEGEMVTNSLEANGGILISAGVRENADISNITVLDSLSSSGIVVNGSTVYRSNIDVNGGKIERVFTYGGELNITNGEIAYILGQGVVINITGGKVSSEDTAIEIDGNTTLNIGTKDTTLDINNPEIKGLNKAISSKNNDGGNVNFYDGVIISPEGQQFVGVNINEVGAVNENGTPLTVVYEKYTENGVELEKAYLSINMENVARIYTNDVTINLENLSKDEYELNAEENYCDFTSIESAAKACLDNATTPSKIYLIKDIDSAINSVTIPANKNVEIDLNGKTISVVNVIVNGSLTISNSDLNNGSFDSTITNNGTVTYNSGTANKEITNNNKLIINNGNITADITNNENGTTKMTGGTVKNINNLSNKKYTTNPEDAAVYVIGGEITNRLATTTSGDIVINQAEGATVDVNEIYLDNASGKLEINNGTYDAIRGISAWDETVTISNAEVTTIGNVGGSVIGNLTIDNSTIDSLNNGGETNISNSNFVSVAATTYEKEDGTVVNAIMNFDGTVNVTGGVINGRSSTMQILGTCSFTLDGTSNADDIAFINSGDLTIGAKDGRLNESILIKGKNYGIKNYGNINFYGGKIVGPEGKSILNDTDQLGNSGIIQDIEKLCEIKYTLVDGKEEATLDRAEALISVESGKVISTEKIESGEIDGYEENGNYYFYTITDAAKVSENSATLNVLRNATYAATAEAEVIEENKTITLNLNGYTLEYANENAIINNGTLTIVDNAEGQMITNGTNLILNNGTITLNGGLYVSNNSATALTNTGTATLTNGVQVPKISNTGTITINNAKINIVSNEGDGSITITNASKIGTKNIEITNNTTKTNSNAGVKINGTIDGNVQVTNESGYVSISAENADDIIVTNITNKADGTVSINGLTRETVNNYGVALIYNYGKTIINNSSIRSAYDYNTEDGINLESGEIWTLSASSGTNIGKVGSNVESTDAQVSGGLSLGGPANKFIFNSGIIKTSSLDAAVVIPENAKLVCTLGSPRSEYRLTTRADDEYEAKIGSRGFKYIKDAVTAAETESEYVNENNVEIVVQQNVIITSGKEITISKDNITIDLNGFELKNSAGTNLITNNGTLEIKDSSSEKTGKIINGYSSSTDNLVVNNKKLTIQDATLDYGSTSMRSIYNNTSDELIINGGNVKIIYKLGDGTITVNNGTVGGINTPVSSQVGGSGAGYSATDDYGDIIINNNSTIGSMTIGNCNVEINDSVLTGNLVVDAQAIITVNNSSVKTTTNVGTLNVVNNSTLQLLTNIGTANIKDSQIVSDSAILYTGYDLTPVAMVMNRGELNIENSTIEYTGSITTRYALYLLSGTTNFVSGKVKSTGGAIYMSLGGRNFTHAYLTLGKNDTTVNTESPEIEGGTYGIYKEVTTTLQDELCFYDGIIKGGTKAITQDRNTALIYDKPMFYKVEYVDDEKTAQLVPDGAYAGIATIGDIYYNLDELQTMFNTANNKTIVIQQNFNLYETIEVNGNVTIDLNGHSIEGNIDTGLFNNNGTLNIVDSSTEGTKGHIKNYAGAAISGTGLVNVDSGIEVNVE